MASQTEEAQLQLSKICSCIAFSLRRTRKAGIIPPKRRMAITECLVASLQLVEELIVLPPTPVFARHGGVNFLAKLAQRPAQQPAAQQAAPDAEGPAATGCQPERLPRSPSIEPPRPPSPMPRPEPAPMVPQVLSLPTSEEAAPDPTAPEVPFAKQSALSKAKKYERDMAEAVGQPAAPPRATPSTNRERMLQMLRHHGISLTVLGDMVASAQPILEATGIDQHDVDDLTRSVATTGELFLLWNDRQIGWNQYMSDHDYCWFDQCVREWAAAAPAAAAVSNPPPTRQNKRGQAGRGKGKRPIGS